jgi:TetR/AcrR family transcriptional repressor of nem operon
MRYDAEHKQRTRERVLTEAARAIRAEGPDRVAVAGLMAKAGLTHGGFYAHFASKDDLIAEAIGVMGQQMADRLAHLVERRSPAATLVAYIDFYLSQEHRDRRESGCPLPALAADLPRLQPQARERYASAVAGLTGRLAEALAAVGHADAEAEAASVLSELVGALSLARAVGDGEQSDLILSRSRAALKRRLGIEDLS